MLKRTAKISKTLDWKNTKLFWTSWN